MAHVFRAVLAALVILLLLQLVVNILVSTGRPGSWSSSSSASGSSVDGQLVTGESRRIHRPSVPSSKSPTSSPSEGRPLGFWSLFGRDAFAYLSLLLQPRPAMPLGPLPLCPEVPPNLVGPIQNSSSLLIYEKLSDIFGGPSLGPGGRWRPANCTARHRVALIVPYRDRNEHLRVFLRHMHPFLQRQEIDYGIYVVGQSPRGSFNRGVLMNIGFIESLRFYDYDCFIFHDVDMLPENDHNLYWCPTMPRHMAVAVDKEFYKLPYYDMFGGVEAFTRSHFELVNGFSNKYFGWGSEDDDLNIRLKFRNLILTRYPPSVARYTMQKHATMKPNPERFNIVRRAAERIEKDGLNSLRYILKAIEERKLYTWIYVEIDEQILSGLNSTSKNTFQPTQGLSSTSKNAFQPTQGPHSTSKNTFQPTQGLNSTFKNAFQPTQGLNSTSKNSTFTSEENKSTSDSGMTSASHR